MSSITGGAVSIHSYERVAKQRAELKKQNAALVAALDRLRMVLLRDSSAGGLFEASRTEAAQIVRDALKTARGES